MKAIYQQIKSAFLRSWFIDTYCKVLAKIEMKRMNLSTSLWFFKRSMYSFCGKEGVVDAREVYSRGGYKYYQIEISKFPFSANSDYAKLK